jgi:hypothetical protein
MCPQVLGQALVGRVRLGREDRVGQLALQATAGHRQTALAEFPHLVTVSRRGLAQQVVNTLLLSQGGVHRPATSFADPKQPPGFYVVVEVG